eukprot:TRINITY_DN14518_c0_g1_i6.p1 TRINITY_DN14518_c0_g1~~TRINITY_DN14518_c0_g1_i6.p1  ORF type:complete len:215 (-),score=25.21 TRINITY_DN14518_c0_g1_i6:374-1018(-)
MAFHTSHDSWNLNLSILWRVQNKLHSNDNLHLLPCTLLLAASGLVLYAHFNQGGSVRNYSAINVMAVLPLAILERKILTCAQPVSSISKASGNVLLLHMCFLALRLPRFIMDGFFGALYIINVGSLIAGCILLCLFFRFRLNRGTFYQHRVCLFVAFFGFTAAVLTEGVDAYLRRNNFQLAYLYPTGSYMEVALLGLVETAALYIELLAFMPAV